MSKQFKRLALMLLVIVGIQPVAANQVAVNSPVIDTAYQLVGDNCESLHHNQACYGHAQLVAEARDAHSAFAFSSSGDIEDLVKIQSLRLSGLNTEAQTWGIAMLALQANLPESSPQNVTILAFGDVALENAVPAPTAIHVSTTTYANIRQSPSTQAAVLGSMMPGDSATAVERLQDNSWLRIQRSDDDVTGWISASLLDTDEDVNLLNVAAPRSMYYKQPMQAFVFESGQDEPQFSELPHNGLLIQTPEGVGEVNLLVNEVNIQLGSTVFFQAQAGGFMTVSTIEGHADVRVGNIEFTAFPGTQVQVPLDANLNASGPPQPPQPYDFGAVEYLPFGLLQREVEAGPPMSQVSINTRLEEAAQESAANLDCPTSNCDPTDAVSCPGQSCSAPGHNGDCPGQSCDAPGQGGDCPGNSCNAPGHNKDASSDDVPSSNDHANENSHH